MVRRLSFDCSEIINIPMTYSLISYHNLNSEQKENFFKFCYECSFEDQPAAKNMWEDDWHKNPHTLPYVLEIEKRFDWPNGNFFVLMQEEKIIGCSGVYKSIFDSNVAIAGVRSWVHSRFRHDNLNREYFLPEEKKWAIENNCKVVALTFNQYNKNIIEIFKRRRLGEKSNRLSTREPKHLFYSGLKEVPFSVKIQHTEQWLIYESISTYEPNWELIKYHSGL